MTRRRDTESTRLASRSPRVAMAATQADAASAAIESQLPMPSDRDRNIADTKQLATRHRESKRRATDSCAGFSHASHNDAAAQTRLCTCIAVHRHSTPRSLHSRRVELSAAPTLKFAAALSRLRRRLTLALSPPLEWASCLRVTWAAASFTVVRRGQDCRRKQFLGRELEKDSAHSLACCSRCFAQSIAFGVAR